MEDFEEYDFEMIDELLVTEDGFLNEVAYKKICSFINNLEPTHERLKNNPEWYKKRITNKKDIISNFGKCAIMLSPYSFPSHLEEVICYLNKCLDRDVLWDEYDYAQLSLCDINKVLYKILYKQHISYFDEWNEPKKDWRKSKFETFQEACDFDADYDFIDLDALLHNACLEIRSERRSDDDFNKKFEERHGNEIRD